MTTPKVGMKLQCVSIRAKGHPEDRCPSKPLAGSEWCGKHDKQKCRVRYVAPAAAAAAVIEHEPPAAPVKATATATKKKESARRDDVSPAAAAAAAAAIRQAWAGWLARRAGPLLYFREESNNPFDFFSSDPVAEIPLADFISYVDSDGKGYIMDAKSLSSLLEHATKSGETPANPFNRAPLPPLLLRRLKRHGATKLWESLKPVTEEQKLTLAVTDVFRSIEDLGYYTDPTWFMDLGRLQLQQIYIELADIWYHRAGLSSADRVRIVPGGRNPFAVPVLTAVVMQQKALRPLLLETCRLLVSAATARADKQLGVMYTLGALSLVSPGAATAYPWMADMFAPGVTRIVGGRLQAVHPSVFAY